MARIASVNIPDDKVVLYSLQYIKGIGPYSAAAILKKASIDPLKRVKNLEDSEILKIIEIINNEYIVENDLARQVSMNIKFLMDLGCYRGLRHRKKLPVRGQRTHTNARTRKGKAKAIAGKKKAN